MESSLESSSRFIIHEAPLDVVEKFWSSSPQAVLFNNPHILRVLSDDCSWFVAKKGDEPFLVWPVHLGPHKKPAIPPFAYFFGPMWSPSSGARSASSVFADRLTLYNEMIGFLISRFGGIANSFHDSLTDIRAFSWWGHESGLNFRVEPRFTARITNLQTMSADDLLASFRELRRREITKIQRGEGHKIESAIPESLFVDFYSGTFERQGQMPDNLDLRAIPGLLTLANDGHGFTIGARNVTTNQLESLALVLVEGSTANLVLNATDRERGASGIGAWTIYNSIEKARAIGVDTFDFNGANSPKRADDKHSFGAKEALYFHIEYQGN